MMNAPRTFLMGCVLGSLATPALAQPPDDDVPPVVDAPDGQYAVKRGVQGPAGMVAARILLDINLSADAAGEPISLAPDLYVGVTDRLQLGLVHQGPMGWQARPGLGLCLTGEDHGCPKVYDNLGLDMMVGLAFERVHLSVHSTLFFDSFDPTAASIAAGLAGKLHLGGRASLYFDPKVAIALLDRDVNDDAIYVPLEIQYQIGARTVLKVLTGLSGELSAFGDTYEIPVGLGLVRNLSEHFDLAARFSFDNLLGHEEMGVARADARSLAVLLNIRS